MGEGTVEGTDKEAAENVERAIQSLNLALRHAREKFILVSELRICHDDVIGPNPIQQVYVTHSGIYFRFKERGLNG